jgi:hypothetical protein
MGTFAMPKRYRIMISSTFVTGLLRGCSPTFTDSTMPFYADTVQTCHFQSKAHQYRLRDVASDRSQGAGASDYVCDILQQVCGSLSASASIP